jgi:xanthine dehydrogenase accessory factor
VQNWLNSLERLLRQGRTAILATLVRRNGHSPDAVGTQLLISTDQIFGVLNNTDRLAQVVTHAREMLSQRRQWSTRSFALSPIVGTENGDCEFIFQSIDQRAAAGWLNDAQVAVAQNRAAVLVCKPDITPTLAYDHADIEPALHKLFDELLAAADPNGVRTTDDRLLLRLPGNPLRVAVAGNGAIASALIRHLALLPCRVVWLTSGTPLDSGVPVAALTASEVDSLASQTHLVIASNDHELDVVLCGRALRHPDLRFIGCLGSARKAALLRESLHQAGFDPSSTARIITPVGLPDIDSNHPSVIAVSIIAQLYSQRAAEIRDQA